VKGIAQTALDKVFKVDKVLVNRGLSRPSWEIMYRASSWVMEGSTILFTGSPGAKWNSRKRTVSRTKKIRTISTERLIKKSFISQHLL